LALGQVRDEVMEAMRLRHEPLLYGSLGGRAPTNPSTPSDLAERAWAVTQNTASVPLLWPRSRCEEEFPDNTPPPEMRGEDARLLRRRSMRRQRSVT